MGKISSKNQAVLVCLALIIVTAAVFYQVYTFEFVNYDDPKYVYENPNIQQGITLKAVKWAFTSGYVGNWHPLTWLSHMLDWQLFGNNPAGHHLISLFFHIANTLLLFLVFRQMTDALWQSAFIAALFALHPLHVESVAWVAERKDVLNAFFWMLTMFAYLRYVKHPNIIRYLLTLSTFALGLMTKPMLVTLPFVLLLLDYWPLVRIPYKQTAGNIKNTEHKNRFSHRWIFHRLVLEKLPFFALSAVSSIVTFLVQQSGGAMEAGKFLPLDARILNAFVSYVRYISKIFYPRHLAVLYPYSTVKLPIWQPLLYLLLLIGITVITIYAARHRRYLLVGWLWYLGTLVPVIGLVQVGAQAMADRYTYLPSIGIFIMVAWGVTDLFDKWHYRRIVLWTLAALSLTIMLFCTRIQVRYWQNSLTMARHALEVTKNNYLMHNNYGCAMFEKEKFDQAMIHFTKALQINPNHFNARKNIGSLLLKQGRIDEAIANLTMAIRLKNDQPEVYCYLGSAYEQQGKYDLAVQNYTKALFLRHDYFDAINLLAITLKKQGKYDEAINQWEKALGLKPDSFYVHYNLAQLLEEQGKTNDALKEWEKALQIEPDNPLVHFHLGGIFYTQNKYDMAVRYWSETVKLKNDFADAYNNLAWISATARDTDFYNPINAVTFAQKACELSEYKRPDFLDTLAVAYASNGDYNKAIETSEMAIQLCQSLEQEELKEQLLTRLALYKDGKPYTEADP